MPPFPPGARAVRLLGALSVLFGIALIGCHSSPPPAQGRSYHIEGTVISVMKPQQQVIIDTKAIPGFMAAMTMPYPVNDPHILDPLTPGDQVTATLVVDGENTHLQDIVIVKKSTGPPPAAAGPAALARPGDLVPDFGLLNQDGRLVRLRQFRGKAVLLTFIYTRCPMPDYCPLMSRNFARLDRALAKNRTLYAKTQLLSISFDPAHDTPAVLRKYGLDFLPGKGSAGFAHWQFAALRPGTDKEVLKFFGVYTEAQKSGLINHTLCTAIIAPDGKLYKSYTGNDWKPAAVLSDLLSLFPGQSTSL